MLSSAERHLAAARVAVWVASPAAAPSAAPAARVEVRPLREERDDVALVWEDDEVAAGGGRDAAAVGEGLAHEGEREEEDACDGGEGRRTSARVRAWGHGHRAGVGEPWWMAKLLPEPGQRSATEVRWSANSAAPRWEGVHAHPPAGWEGHVPPSEAALRTRSCVERCGRPCQGERAVRDRAARPTHRDGERTLSDEAWEVALVAVQVLVLLGLSRKPSHDASAERRERGRPMRPSADARRRLKHDHRRVHRAGRAGVGRWRCHRCTCSAAQGRRG